MNNKLLSLGAAVTLLLSLSSWVNAVPVYTQTAQGGYPSNALGGSAWTGFTSLMQASHTIDQYANFDDYSILSSYGVVWVDQELSSNLSATELANLQAYYSSNNTEALVILDSNWNDNSYGNNQDNEIFAQNIVDWLSDTSTNKLVLIGENNSWPAWNSSIMQVVGGGLTGECSWGVGAASSTHSLTSGVATVENACGSTIDPLAGNPDMLFDNNFAAVYRSQTTSVPEPSSILLLGLGLLGLGLSRKKKFA